MTSGTVLAIDPGTAKSAMAWIRYGGGQGPDIRRTCIVDNGDVDDIRRTMADPSAVAIEEVQSYGMAVGRDVFETVKWSGWFWRCFHPLPVLWIGRREVKIELCGSARAKDANIRQAIVDRFPASGMDGKGQPTAIGSKKHPGPLYGIKSHEWAAVALGLTAIATRLSGHAPEWEGGPGTADPGRSSGAGA